MAGPGWAARDECGAAGWRRVVLGVLGIKVAARVSAVILVVLGIAAVERAMMAVTGTISAVAAERAVGAWGWLCWRFWGR